MFTPLYYAGQLIIGNPDSAVAVVTLWSKKEKVAERIPPRLFAVMGQLYSPTRGLDPLVRNLLANPSIRHVVVTGSDFAGSGRALQDLFANGFERGRTAVGQECWLVKSQVEACIDIDVSAEAIEELRRGVTLHAVALEALGAKLEELSGAEARPWGRPRVFEKKVFRATVLPGADVVHVVRGRRVADTWLQILDRVMRFGREGATHYGTSQKEIIGLVSVVEEEDPEDFYVPEYLPCTKKDLEEYFPRVLSGKEYPDTSYTYGQRLRTHFGVDQIEEMITKLAADLDTRSATSVLWDPGGDNKGHGAPCINHIWARVRDGKVYLTAIIRSNDMYSAWPENAFALRKLQELIRRGVAERAGVELGLGELVTLSESAHVYGDCWADAERVVAAHFEQEVAAAESRQDPAGSFVVSVAGREIVCEHISPAGEHFATYTGHTAGHVANLLTRAGAVSRIDHALYVGRELAKAEAALGSAGALEYVQDQHLKRKG
jgi:thymidylate synthase